MARFARVGMACFARVDMARFAHSEVSLAAGWAGACFSGVRPSEIGLNGAISLGVRLTSDRGIDDLAASCANVCHATGAQRRGATAGETSPCPPCRGDTCAGGEKHSPFLNVVLASTGLRGRVDARGPRRHCSAGLTRTSGQAAGVPSRVRRARRLRRRVAGRMRYAADIASTSRRPRTGGRSFSRSGQASSTQHWPQRELDPAPQRRRRGGSSITRRSVGGLARSSR